MVLTLHGWFFALGGLVAAIIYHLIINRVQAVSIGRSFEDMLLVFLGGLVGARITYGWLHPDLLNHWYQYFTFWQVGLVSFGGLISGLLIAWWLFRARSKPYLWLSALSVAAMAGWSLGRIGNFLQRDAYGIPCNCGQFFYQRVPIQLIEAAGTFLIFCVGWQLFKRYAATKPGLPFFIMVVDYGLLRVAVDSWRALPPVWWVFNSSQLAALVLIVCGIIGLWRYNKTN